MLGIIESVGDRMLRLAIPATAASAASTRACYWSAVCRRCSSATCASYEKRWQCCDDGDCKCLNYRACGCFIGCPC